MLSDSVSRKESDSKKLYYNHCMILWMISVLDCRSKDGQGSYLILLFRMKQFGNVFSSVVI